MKKLWRVLLFLLALIFSGCAYDPGALLILPRTEQNYELLSVQAREILAGSASYTLPGKGDCTASAAEVDLDGDGVAESISFLLKKEGGAFYPVAEIYGTDGRALGKTGEITGTGDRIDAVFFPEFSSEVRGIVLGWGLGDSGIYRVTIAVCGAQGADVLYEGSYREIFSADMDGDGFYEIMLVTDTPDGLGRQVVMLKYNGGVIKKTEPAPLSEGLLVFANAMTANVGFNRAALVIEGYLEPYGYISDIIIYGAAGLKNLYLSAAGVSEETARDMPVWCADANGDGMVELPIPRGSAVTGDGTAEGFRLIDWRRCSESGEVEIIFTTCHNLGEGWFIRLPDRMGQNVMPVQSVKTDIVSGTLFYFVDDEGERGIPLWEIYTLSGSDAETTATACGMTRLAYKNGVLYGMIIYNSVRDIFYSRRSLPALFSTAT